MKQCNNCCGTGFTFGDSHSRFREVCPTCSGRGEVSGEAGAQTVYFTLYEKPNLRNATITQARSRFITGQAGRFIAVTINDDGTLKAEWASETEMPIGGMHHRESQA